MQWKSPVIILGLLCFISLSAGNEREQTSIQVEYDGKKLEVITPESAAAKLFEHWTRHALAAFIASYAFQKSLRLNYFRRNEYASCVREANTIKLVAKCAERIIANSKLKPSIGNQSSNDGSKWHSTSQTNDSHDSSIMHIRNSKARIKASLKRINDSSPRHAEDHQKNKPPSKQMSTTIAALKPSIKTVSKSKAEIIEKLNKMRKIRPLHLRRGHIISELPESYLREQQKRRNGWVGEFRLSRNKREVVSRSEYQLLNEDAGISPLGVFARSLRNMLHEMKDLVSGRGMSVNSGIENDTADALASSLADRSRQTLDAISGPLKLVSEGIKLGLIAAEQNSTQTDTDNDIPLLIGDESSANSTHSQRTELRSSRRSHSAQNIDGEELLKLLAEVSNLRSEDGKREMAFGKKIYGKVAKNPESIGAGFVEERGLNGQPLYFTAENVSNRVDNQRASELFEKLYSSIGVEQMKQLNTIGFTKLSKEQLKLMYGVESPYRSREILQRYINVDEEHLRRYVEKDIQLLAKMDEINLSKNEATHLLTHGFVPSLVLPLEGGEVTLSEPKVLAPLVLSPIVLFPSVLGAFLLNPWTFSPLLTSAIINAPLIIRPQKIPSLMFSPLVYRPNILSYGIVKKDINPAKQFSPFVLPLNSTPILLLSKLILNPDIFSNSTNITNVFSEQRVNLSPQFIHSLMYPDDASPSIEQLPRSPRI